MGIIMIFKQKTSLFFLIICNYSFSNLMWLRQKLKLAVILNCNNLKKKLTKKQIV